MHMGPGKMKFWAIVFGVTGLILIVCNLALAKWSGFQGGPLNVLGGLLLNTRITVRLVLLCEMSGLVVAGVGLGKAIARSLRPPFSRFLSILTFIIPLFGLISTAFELMLVYATALRTHTTVLFVMGPSIAISLLPLAAGLVAGTVAALANALPNERIRVGEP
jgi:hypothetical protein